MANDNVVVTTNTKDIQGRSTVAGQASLKSSNMQHQTDIQEGLWVELFYRFIAVMILMLIVAGGIWGVDGVIALLVFALIISVGAAVLTIAVGAALFLALGGERLERLLERIGIVPVLVTMTIGATISVVYVYGSHIWSRLTL